MAESRDDKKVDAIVARLRALLDELEAAQAKDVADEDGEYQGKNLKDAEGEAFRRFRQAKVDQVGNTENPDDQADNKKAMRAMPKVAARTRQVERAAQIRDRG